MPMIDKATGRVIAVLVLVIVIGASSRGYLPGVERAWHQEPPHSSASLAYVVALLGISLAIVAAAVIARLRDPRAPAANAGTLSDRFGSGVGRPGWRVLLIAAGLLVVWLLLVWLLMRLIGPQGMGQLPSGTEPNVTPTPGSGTAPRPEPQQPNSGGDVLKYLSVSTAVFLVLIGAGAAARRRRNTVPHIAATEVRAPSAPAGASESLARAAQVGLAEIGDLSREPREAIIACYAAMERELAHVPEAAPQDFDTPTEVLARAVERRALHADNAAQLVNLFAEARFSRHVMTEQHREIAVGVLQLVLVELRSVL